jgi:hypothetical protein
MSGLSGFMRNPALLRVGQTLSAMRNEECGYIVGIRIKCYILKKINAG